MAVVYVPEDKRWQVMGQGFGELIGTYVGQQLKQSDDQRVSQVIRDIYGSQDIKPEDKMLEAGRREGTKGLHFAKLYTDAQMQQMKIEAEKTEAPLRKAQADLAEAHANLYRQQMGQAPLKQRELEADVALKEAKAAEIPTDTLKKQGELEELNLRIKNLTALNAREPDITKREKNERELSDLKVQQESTAMELAGGAPSGMTPAQQAVATGGAKAYTDIAKKGVEQQQTLAGQAGTKVVPGLNPGTTILGAAGVAASVESVLDSIEADPRSVGGVTAKLKEWAASSGYFNSDPQFQQQLAATHQLVGEAASGVKGFMSAQSIGLARTLSPSVIHSKVQDLLESNEMLKVMAAKLDIADKSLPASYNKVGLEEARSRIQAQLNRTNSLWSTRRQDEKGNPLPTKQQAVFYKGRQVDPETLRPIEGGAKEFGPRETVDLGGGESQDGATVNWVARQKGMTPEAYVEGRRQRIGQEP